MSDRDDFRREYLGEWNVKRPDPSPGPWTSREARVQVPFTNDRMSVYVVLDANGKQVAECEREVDAEFIARNAPRTCKRCTECEGQEHHWIDNDEAFDEQDPTHACKHCDALGDDCDTCGGKGKGGSPDAEKMAPCPACKGTGVRAVD